MRTVDLRFDFAHEVANLVDVPDREGLLRLLRLRAIVRRLTDRTRAARAAYHALAPAIRAAGGIVYGDGVRDRSDGRIYYRYTRATGLLERPCLSDVAVEAPNVQASPLGERAARLDREDRVRADRYWHLRRELETKAQAFFVFGVPA